MSEPSLPRSRPRLLVSVREPEEARSAWAAGANLIDAKDPALGALGALPPEAVRAIVAQVGAMAATSAVAGGPDGIAAMAATGATYVKVAIGPSAAAATLGRAAASAPRRLIAVLFAEDGIAPEAVPALARAGFAGAMIDTRGKDGRRLTDLVPDHRLAGFVNACRDHGLLSGLAGSLRIEDVPMLAALAPSYLGFRGGLCLGGNRRSALDPRLVRAAAEAVRALGQRDAA